MKKIFSISLLAGIFLVAFAQSVKIKIKGSDTVLPISQKEAEVYMKEHAGSSVTVVGGGSGVGIAALEDGSTDIAMSSRKLKMEEKMKFTDAKRNIKEVVVAYDALSIIVHPSNKISQLTREQLEEIFTGKITNWKEVGGDNMPIVVYTRESSSGTSEFMKEHVMSKKNFATSALSMPATGAIVQSVSQTKGAIGYIGFAYMEKTVKSLKVSFDKGANYIKPSVENAKSGKYPITRTLQYYYDAKSEQAVKPFIDFVLSKEGQKLVSEVGYITLK
jgi:phosphate transport system substrate-binding protein